MQTFSLNNRLGETLKDLRRKKNWTLRQAGEKSGYSAAYLSMLERGVHSTTGKSIKVTPEALQKLAEVYDYPYNLLMISAGYGEYGDAIDELAVTSEPSYLKEESADYYVSEEYLSSLQNSTVLTTNYDTLTHESIADRLIKLRKEKELSQQEFANQLSLFTHKEGLFIFKFFNEDEITEIEKGEIKPDSDFILAASDFYGVSCDWLLRGQEYKTEKPDNLTNASNSLETIIDMLAKIKKESDSLTQSMRELLPNEINQNSK